ncbi:MULTISPECIES: flavodoxin [Tissierellales]|jgi:flavodoxin short chain|uniref:Flavodoxin n=1 Tax=Acidilutibacter cellobiosedens TaxID=2507161 RepID=A0A410QBL7_9FIRM|nr:MULTISPECIES: flavodoxin [Tissierellales]QAT61264.1 flavodoxin [Acidilutibacter cellobiosedens]SCL96251.1 Flavodoxin [Sporanaerobacter sp. PP17-6a]
MKKLSIIYWSGTGNTEEMANIIYESAKEQGAEVILKFVNEAALEDISESDVTALGCPAMGDEVLEESEMEPFIESIEDKISGKKLALFGSYGWGDGKWMIDWEERMSSKGANIIHDALIINGKPESDEDTNLCREFGKSLVK